MLICRAFWILLSRPVWPASETTPTANTHCPTNPASPRHLRQEAARLDVTSGLGAHAPGLHDVRVLVIVASRFSPVTIPMAPEIIRMPDGRNFTVTPVFSGFFFMSNEPSTHPHAYPIGWTVVLNTQERHRPFGDKHPDSSDWLNGHGHAEAVV